MTGFRVGSVVLGPALSQAPAMTLYGVAGGAYAPAAGAMTVDDVRARVAEIERIGSERDYEMAHGKEDDLREDVLRAIADGSPIAADLAREALATSQLDFARWCA